MCTILILHRVHPDFPTIIAANRDEFFARPATPPRQLHTDPTAIGGIDLERGGTWMGATADGFFVGLTNQRSRAPADKTRKSRGDVVSNALAHGNTASVRAMMEALHPADYNPFNLLYGDAHHLEIAYAHPGMTHTQFETVPTGTHALPNARLNAPAWAKVTRAKDLLHGVEATPWPTLQQHLIQTLADRTLPPSETWTQPKDDPMPSTLWRHLGALCVKTPLYGTRSSTLVALQPGQTTHYLFCDGDPGQTPFVSYTDLFASP